jgi:hypothetical protein
MPVGLSRPKFTIGIPKSLIVGLQLTQHREKIQPTSKPRQKTKTKTNNNPEMSSGTSSSSTLSSSSGSSISEIPHFQPVDDVQEFVPLPSSSSSDSLEHHEGSSSSASSKAGYSSLEEEARKDAMELDALEQFEKDIFETIKNHGEKKFEGACRSFYQNLKQKFKEGWQNDVFQYDSDEDEAKEGYGKWIKGTRQMPGLPLKSWSEVDKDDYYLHIMEVIKECLYEPKIDKKIPPPKKERRKRKADSENPAKRQRK